MVTSKKDMYNFTYAPDTAGSRIIATKWQSDKGREASAYSEADYTEVKEAAKGALPLKVIYIAAIAIALVAAALIGYAYTRRAKKMMTLRVSYLLAYEPVMLKLFAAMFYAKILTLRRKHKQ
ncbi:MAG: hypothetical protein WHU54_01470 [Candidatus Bathyarchaeia archaeon]